MKPTLTAVWLLFAATNLFGSNLQIQPPILYEDQGEYYAIVTLSWENAWYSARNHDAVWLFGKFLRGDNGYVHASLTDDGHVVERTLTGQNVSIDVPEDGTGAFIRLGADYRGPVEVTVRLRIDDSGWDRFRPRNTTFKVYGLEMVYIPEGGFTLGDPNPRAHAFGSLYQSDADGNAAGLYRVETEDQVIDIGPQEGNLYYQSPTEYEGDRTGTLPAEYPKGVSPFYIMKYEPTQGQYADFLNTLSENQSVNRAIFGGRTYYQKRGTIRLGENGYSAGVPDRPCGFIGWDDGMAFADWAGLRPMTELEFTKAARGPGEPIDTEFPWNTGSKALMQRTYTEAGDLVMNNGWEERLLTDEAKPYFGASYYWVMDLAGSTWERVITIGDDTGRAFTGSHGDGEIGYYGAATNEDWPQGPGETSGFGFRGGGYYTFGRPYSEFNPFSPIAYRRFGGWAGSNRVAAYGQRFVRTVR